MKVISRVYICVSIYNLVLDAVGNQLSINHRVHFIGAEHFFLLIVFGPLHEILVLITYSYVLKPTFNGHTGITSGARCLCFSPSLSPRPVVCMWVANTLARLRICTVSPKPLLLAVTICTAISCDGQFIVFIFL